MYTVRPYFECAVAPEPAEVLYAVRSYHNEELKNGVCCNYLAGVVKGVKSDEMRNDDALVDRIYKEQLNLIDELNAFIEHLKTVSIPESDFKPPPVISAKKKPVKQKKKFASSSGDYAKKGVTKVQSRDGIARYNLSSRPFAISVVTTNVDRNCLIYLSKIGQKEAIVFSGIEDIQCGDHETKSLVNVKISTNNDTLVMAGVNGAKVRGRVGVWKLLGALVGVYPMVRAGKTATHIDRWLFLANAMLVGRHNELTVSRLMCSVLSQHDFLVPGTNFVTLADIILFSVLSSNCYHANNVELWQKRMTQILKNV